MVQKTRRGLGVFSPRVDAAVQAWAARNAAGNWHALGTKGVREEPDWRAAASGGESVSETDDQIARAVLSENEARPEPTHKLGQRISGFARAGIRIIGSRLPEAITRRGWMELRGQRVARPQDLAELLQFYRDPRAEIFHWVYLKGDRVVGHEAVTAGLPHKTPVTSESGPSHRQRLIRQLIKAGDRMARLGADGFYIAHNHPGGNVQPSPADYRVTDAIRRVVPGFKGHIVIDHTQYAFIGEITMGPGRGGLQTFFHGIPPQARVETDTERQDDAAIAALVGPNNADSVRDTTTLHRLLVRN